MGIFARNANANHNTSTKFSNYSIAKVRMVSFDDVNIQQTQDVWIYGISDTSIKLYFVTSVGVIWHQSLSVCHAIKPSPSCHLSPPFCGTDVVYGLKCTSVCIYVQTSTNASISQKGIARTRFRTSMYKRVATLACITNMRADRLAALLQANEKQSLSNLACTLMWHFAGQMISISGKFILNIVSI